MKKFEVDNYSSFSGSVNELQGDKVKGSLAIVYFNELEKQEIAELKNLEKKLEQKRTLIKLINSAIVNIDDHLKLEKPTVIADKNGVYIINKDLKTEKVINNYQ